MREIKFRAKSIKKNEWVYGYYIFREDFNGATRHDIVSASVPIQIHPGTLNQLTGSRDMDCKEIYEGDIANLCGSPINAIVIWDDSRGGFVFRICDNQHMAMNHASLFRVIGNINDNPELFTLRT